MVQNAANIKSCARDLLNIIQKGDVSDVQTKLLDIKMDNGKQLCSILNFKLKGGSVVDYVSALEGEKASGILRCMLDALNQVSPQAKLAETINLLRDKLQKEHLEEMLSDSASDSSWVERAQRQQRDSMSR